MNRDGLSLPNLLVYYSNMEITVTSEYSNILSKFLRIFHVSKNSQRFNCIMSTIHQRYCMLLPMYDLLQVREHLLYLHGIRRWPDPQFHMHICP